MKPRTKVIELLRTLDEVRDTFNSGSGGGGVRLMPSDYSLHSYQELERRLGQMRDNGDRQLWWHVSMRYRWGNADDWQKVASRKGRQGRIPLLPERSELRIQGETLEQGMVWVKLYTWSAEVRPTLVTAGVDRLTALMYGGEWWRLTLPKPFLERLAVA